MYLISSNCIHRFLRLAMASIMDILKIKPFVEVSVGQLLWGYEDPLLKLAKDVVPKEQKLPYEEFGVLYGKNSTSPVTILIIFSMIFCANDHRIFGSIPFRKLGSCNNFLWRK